MQPQNPNPNYDFILKDAPAPKSSILPKNPIVILIGIVILGMLLVLVYGVLSSNKGSGTNSFIDSVGQAQEISRVSQLEQPNIKDPNISALAATATAATSSEQAQLSNYLTSHKVKLDPKKLALYKNSSTDTQLSAAAQTNSLDQAYANYLKGALNKYATSLQNSYAATKNNDARAMLSNAFNSTQTILNSAQLKSQ